MQFVLRGSQRSRASFLVLETAPGLAGGLAERSRALAPSPAGGTAAGAHKGARGVYKQNPVLQFYPTRFLAHNNVYMCLQEQNAPCRSCPAFSPVFCTVFPRKRGVLRGAAQFGQAEGRSLFR